MSPQAAREELTCKAGIDYDPDVVRAFLRVSRGRVARVLGPMSWITMVPLLGTGVASAANASAHLGEVAAAIIGGGGAAAAAAALGLVATAGATAPAAHARPAPVVAAAPAPGPEVHVVTAGAVAPEPPPAPAPTASPESSMPARPSSPTPVRAAQFAALSVPEPAPAPAPAAPTAAPTAAPPAAPPAPTIPPPTPPPPSSSQAGSQVQVNASPIAQVTVSTRQPLPVCAPVTAGVVQVRC